MDFPTIRLLTVRECCRSAGFSRATFYRLAKTDPKFPSQIKIGGSTRVSVAAWEAYIELLSRHAGEAS